MSNPVLSGTDNSLWPLVVQAGQWSPWITAIGSDPDQRTVTGDLTLYDQAGNASNTVQVGPLTFQDPLRAQLQFPPGTPALVEYDQLNPLRFRVKNTNA